VRSKHHSGGDGTAILISAAVVGVLVALVWTGGALAGLLAHQRPVLLNIAQAGGVLARLPRHLGDPAQAWPPGERLLLGSPVLVWSCLGVALTVMSGLVATGVRLARRVIRSGHGEEEGARWARRGDLARLRVRRAGAGRLVLGVHEGRLLAGERCASVLVAGPSQVGKSTGLVIPALLEWQGPTVSTSVKSDVLAATYAARGEQGEVKVFDPTGATELPAAGWSPIAAAGSWMGARRMAARLLELGMHPAARSSDEVFWRPAAARYLAPLLLAAHRARATMADLLMWVAIEERQEPTLLLKGHPDQGAATALAALESVWIADERFRSSVLQTLATALDPWQEPQVAVATTHPDITPGWLLEGCNTLFVVAPAAEQRRLRGLFAALIADVAAGAFAHAHQTGAPLDPGLLLALDEAANVAPLPNLDELASTGPGQGVALLTVLQNLSQAFERWGRDRTETILVNHRARLFCSGIADQATLSYLGQTLGEQEVQRVSTHRQALQASGGSRTVSSDFRRLAGAHRVRQAPENSALLVYGRLPAAQIQLRPWYRDRRLRALASPATEIPT
jgi:type IV secretion system protein VirD4